MIGDLRRYAAVNARVRALLATLLGFNGLEALTTYPSQSAVLDALLRTPYGTVGNTPYAERALLDRLVGVGRAVLGLVAGPEREFLRQYLLRHELENLKVLIRAVHRHDSWESIAPYILPLPGIATINPRALADAHDVRDLVARLSATAYGPPLRAALHRLREAGPFALEVTVELEYYDRLWSTADTLKRADARCARRLLGILFDILNLNWIARYRDALRLSPEEVLNYTLRQGRWVTTEVRRALAEETGQAWDMALARTPYGRLLSDVHTQGFEAASTGLWRFLGAEIRRTFMGYPFHIGVPLGFLLVQEIEIRDLQILLAAKSIGVPGPEILDHVASLRH
jgi:V/A-type H+-transporting ATPase subunit C